MNNIKVGDKRREKFNSSHGVGSGSCTVIWTGPLFYVVRFNVHGFCESFPYPQEQEVSTKGRQKGQGAQNKQSKLRGGDCIE